MICRNSCWNCDKHVIFQKSWSKKNISRKTYFSSFRFIVFKCLCPRDLSKVIMDYGGYFLKYLIFDKYLNNITQHALTTNKPMLFDGSVHICRDYLYQKHMNIAPLCTTPSIHVFAYQRPM